MNNPADRKVSNDMIILCQAALQERKVQRPFREEVQSRRNSLSGSAAHPDQDEDMVYSPVKYRETEGIKERNRLFKNRIPLAYE